MNNTVVGDNAEIRRSLLRSVGGEGERGIVKVTEQ